MKKSSVFVSVLLLFVIHQNTNAQSVPPTSKKPPTNTGNTIEKELLRLKNKIRDSQSTSDSDLDRLITLATRQGQSADIRVKAVEPIAYLSKDKVTPSQSKKIIGLITALARLDDIKTDPDGKVKVYMNGIIFNKVVKERRLIAVLMPLLKDSRSIVRSATEESIAALRYQ